LSHLLGIACGEGGGAEGIGGMGVGRDDTDGEAGLERVFGVERHDGVHRAVLARRAGLEVLVGDRRQFAAELGEVFAVVGAGGVCGGSVERHGGPRWLRKPAEVVLVWLFVNVSRALGDLPPAERKIITQMNAKGRK
jgi:hypothetical protein